MKKFPFFDITNKARFAIIFVLSLFIAWGAYLLTPASGANYVSTTTSDAAYLHDNWFAKINDANNDVYGDYVKTIT